MSECKFKVGDKVRVLIATDEFGNERHSPGTIGTIDRIDYYFSSIMPILVRPDRGSITFWYAENELELYAESEGKYTTIDECWEKISAMKKLLEEFEELADIQLRVSRDTHMHYQSNRIFNDVSDLKMSISRFEKELERYEEQVLPPIPTINLEIKPERCSYWDYEKHDLSTWNGHDCNSCNCRTEGNTYDNAKCGVMVNGDRYCTLNSGVEASVLKAFCKEE